MALGKNSKFLTISPLPFKIKAKATIAEDTHLYSTILLWCTVAIHKYIRGMILLQDFLKYSQQPHYFRYIFSLLKSEMIHLLGHCDSPSIQKLTLWLPRMLSWRFRWCWSLACPCDQIRSHFSFWIHFHYCCEYAKIKDPIHAVSVLVVETTWCYLLFCQFSLFLLEHRSEIIQKNSFLLLILFRNDESQSSLLFYSSAL